MNATTQRAGTGHRTAAAAIVRVALALALLVPIVGAPALATADDAGMRTWQSSQGAEITAQFVKMSRSVVYLKGENGKTVRIQLSALSHADQAVARSLGGQGSGKTSTVTLKPGEIVGMPDVEITSGNDPTKPVPGNVRRFARDHAANMALTKQGGFDLAFLGDSITSRWRYDAARWNKYFAKYKPANFGIRGDRAENVLWRLNAGELVGTTPKVVVVMLGTNNTHFNTAGEIAVGVGTVLKKLRTTLPEIKIVLLAIFPRKEAALRAKTDGANKFLAKMHDGKYVHFVDINSTFLNEDGSMKNELFSDGVHLTAAGYDAWGKAMLPTLEKLMPDVK